MTFNEDKFIHMRYGTGIDLPNYHGPIGTSIEMCTEVEDLGVTMCNDYKFESHIDQIVKKSRSQIGWMMRVFETREERCLLTLFKSLILPHLEYCCQLWSPKTIGLIRKIESVQRNFTFRIRGLQQKNYWQRLQHLKLYSLERRRERYMVIYVWKIIQTIVPNFNDEAINIQTRWNDRRGLTCRIPNVNRLASTRLQTLKENSFMINGPKLFNIMPREVRDFDGTLIAFKNKLDMFLMTIPDKPALPHYAQSSAGNSLLEQIAQQRAEQMRN